MTSNAVVVCTWGEDRDGLPAGVEEPLTLGRKLSASPLKSAGQNVLLSSTWNCRVRIQRITRPFVEG